MVRFVANVRIVGSSRRTAGTSPADPSPRRARYAPGYASRYAALTPRALRYAVRLIIYRADP